jgi:hypothetical protein
MKKFALVHWVDERHVALCLPGKQGTIVVDLCSESGDGAEWADTDCYHKAAIEAAVAKLEGGA